VILERLEVERFGCFDRGSWEFGPGLNVIRGPNEAGKSTIREAIVRVLFDHKRGRKGGVKTADTDVLRWTRWGSSQDFRLSASFVARGERYTLTKDFAEDRIELRSHDDGELEDVEAEVTDRLDDLLGVQSRDVYTTTACLEQQDFAQLAAGREVSELLQQTVTGAGEGVGVQEIIGELHGAVGELIRGLYRPAKRERLGALATSEARIAELAQEMAEMAPIVREAEEAARKIQELGQGLSELETEFQQAEALRERADRQRELATKHGQLSERCAVMERDLRRARDLQERVKGLDEQLARAPDITPEIAEELRDLARRRDETAEQAQRRAEEAAKLTREAAEAAEALQAAHAEAPASETLTRAIRLKGERDGAQAAADDAEARKADLTRERDEARLVRRGRRVLLAVGGLLVIAGVVLGVGVHPALWAVAVAGGLAVVVGLTRRASRPAADIEQELIRADADLVAANQTLEAGQEELAALYHECGAEDVEGLAQVAETARRAVDEATSRHARAQGRAEGTTTDAATATKAAQQLEKALAARLAASGFDDIASFQQAADEVSSLRDDRSKAQNTLGGSLGDRTLQDLDTAFSELNADRLGIKGQLGSPELASAEMTHEQYQELLSRRDRLQEERERLGDDLDEARRIAERPDSDPERLRSLGEHKAAEQERLERLQERREAMELAVELLEQAHQATMSTAADDLEPAIGEFISRLTGGRYDEVAVDRTTLQPQVYSNEKCDVLNLENEASCATREQIFLAARLALTRLLWEREPPLVLMDDPLVNFDPERRQAAVEMIRALADDTQVLLFTCQHWYDEAADRVITL